MGLTEHAGYVDDLTQSGAKRPRVNTSNAIEVYAADGTTLLKTVGPAIITQTWSMVGPLAVSDQGDNFAVPENGTIRYITCLTDTLVGGTATFELINATTAFGTNPQLTVTSPGVAVAAGPHSVTLTRPNVIFPQLVSATASTVGDVTFSVSIEVT